MIAGRHGFNPSASLIAYQKYARANLPRYNATTTALWKFLMELSENDAVASFFNMNDLTQQFIDLEEDYYTLTNAIDFLPFYESIQRQLEIPKQPIVSQDHWNLLYASTVTKTLAIRNHTKITAATDLFVNQTEIEVKIEALTRDRIEYIKRALDEHQKSLERRIQSTIDFAAKNRMKIDEIFNQTLPHDKFSDNQLSAQIIRHQLATPLKIVQSFLSLILIRSPKMVHLNHVPIVEISDTAYKMRQFSNIAKHFQRKLHPFKEVLRDFGNTFKESKVTQLNELKRTIANLTIKIDEILASHKIASDMPADQWKNLRNVIGVARTHIEARKLQMNNVNGTIERLIEMQNLSKCSEIGYDAYRICRNDSIKMVTFIRHVDKFQDPLKKWKEFEQSIYGIVMPWLKMVESTVGNPYVRLSSKHFSLLNQLNNVFERMQQQATHSNELKLIVGDTKQLIELTLGVYNQIQVQSGRQKIANIIERTHRPIVNAPSQLTENRINNLNETITSSLLLEICMTVRAVLGMRAFPYDQTYLKLCDFSMDRPKAINSAHIQQKFLHNLDHSTKRIDRENQSGKKQASVTFYTWEYEDFKGDIMKLLAGEKVIFNADILTAPEPAKRFNAIKFQKIWLNFTLSESARQSEFDKSFDGFQVKMKIIGNNCFYRCDKRVYRLPIDTDYLHTYQVKANANGSKRLKHLVLSPYTIWEMQLVQKSTESERKLQTFMNEVIDLQLIGEGSYFENNNKSGTNLCNNNQLNGNYQQIESPENEGNSVAGENRKPLQIETF